MFLAVNSLLQYGDDQTSVERIVWISPERTQCYVIKIFQDRYPVLKSLTNIEQGLQDGIIQSIEDAWLKPVVEEMLSEKDKAFIEYAWSVIEPIVDVKNEPQIFIKSFRNQMIKEASKQFEISEKTIGRYLRKYWSNGKTINALLPLYANCGGRGKQRTTSEGKVKRGRPKKYPGGKGINVTEEIKQIFRIALKKYYYTKNKAPLKFAYEKMIGDYFSSKQINKDGVKIPIIKDAQSIPTFGQFRYHFHKENNVKREVSTRQSLKRYELNHRPLLGNATIEAIGPGSKFILDSTSFDIYLCSRLNRNWIIGRPCLFYIQDIFSRMVTGVYIGLETSWLSAAMAITNMCEDKVQFCRRYGIEIESHQWQSHHLCDTLLGDRGELFSKEVETLVRNLNVKVENTSSYRGDLKAILERHFRTTNDSVKMMLPGTINPDYRERGARDYRLDAKLDLYQFTQIILKCVLYHNNHHFLANYNREEMMINDDVECIPTKLWEWGIKHRSGSLREVPKEIVLINLLKTAEAVVTHQGIRFKGLYYSCNYVMRERWLEKARYKGTWKVPISYDPRDVSSIHLRGVGEKGFETCYLLEHFRHFQNKSVEEIDYLNAIENMQKVQQNDKELQHKIELITEIETIVKEAEKLSKEQHVKGSKAEKLRGIRIYRDIEKQIQREQDVFDFSSTDKESAKVIPINEAVRREEMDYFGDIELFCKVKEERYDE
ncbi:Mu transposase C-terminal domain-containing protein [Brevibacillus borstelensis]|uniref:Mu transposase C-terminal domain-containing protein n=1 Tax=Brevibacillus borstelensis TaxID=45462 RepID=UPI0020416B77|nr:Mu transposase C-terminal domain-containing protein [Brevibacillus borstelensis]MCM3623679.1 Mu transposase C-terminal domain-containing protein [Brevibacillus borstelensis]